MSSIAFFSGIVRENHRKRVRLNEKLDRMSARSRNGGEQTLETDRKIVQYESEQAKTSFIIIVFAAIAVEAYIYDYAARNLGDAFVRDHLDKLDTVSKWIIVPELVTGRELPQRQYWQGKLKKLVQIWNSITHNKSWDPSALPPADLWRKLKKASAEINQAAIQSVDLLRLLADKISELDPEETPWVQAYLA